MAAVKQMRQSTLDTIGLGTVLEIFSNGKMPADAGELVDKVFGPSKDRGALVISGANGIVGAGKTMQLGSRLQPFGVPIVALDFANAPDGIGKKYSGLVQAFGREGADAVMQSITRLTYDGKRLPSRLKDFKPRFLLEAIPEIRKGDPEITIIVLSGFSAERMGGPAIERGADGYVEKGTPIQELREVTRNAVAARRGD